LLVLELRLRQFAVGDGTFGDLDDGGLILAPGEYARALEIPTGADTENGCADGWFLDEEITPIVSIVWPVSCSIKIRSKCKLINIV